MYSRSFKKSYRKPFAFNGRGSGNLIPASGSLMSHFPGTVIANEMVDKKSGFNYDLTGSHCIAADGAGEHGTTTTDHGTIASFEGTATPSYDGETITLTAGTFYNITFSDGTHFRCAEGGGEFSFDDNGNHKIKWVGDLTNMWAQRQDTYPANLEEGYWSIHGDPVKYPCNPELVGAF